VAFNSNQFNEAGMLNQGMIVLGQTLTQSYI
jgi:hypothetical protein